MVRKKKRQAIAQPGTPVEQSQRFRLRYQDGVVELGMGGVLLLLTLLNQSEFFLDDEELVHWLLILQPILSLVLFASGVFLVRFARRKVLQKRKDVQAIPLTEPMLWINLLMLLLLIAAPLVWPLQYYAPEVMAWVLGGLGSVAGLVFLILGVHNQFGRFMLIGAMIFGLSVVFTFVWQPGSLANQLVILLGSSAILLISGGVTLWQFMRGGDPYQ